MNTRLFGLFFIALGILYIMLVKYAKSEGYYGFSDMIPIHICVLFLLGGPGLILLLSGKDEKL